MGTLCHLRLAEDDLAQAGAVAQVNKDDATVVAAARHPASQRDSFSSEFFAQLACQVGTQHVPTFPSLFRLLAAFSAATNERP